LNTNANNPVLPSTIDDKSGSSVAPNLTLQLIWADYTVIITVDGETMVFLPYISTSSNMKAEFPTINNNKKKKEFGSQKKKRKIQPLRKILSADGIVKFATRHREDQC
jgi:hypothetical protein